MQKSWFFAHKFCASYAMQVLDLAAHLEQNDTLLQMFLSAKGYKRNIILIVNNISFSIQQRAVFGC